jgi:maltose/moltooligosaccharide transporter
MLPWLLTQAGLDSHPAAASGAAIPATVRAAFDCGALVLLLALGWTVVSSSEYPPERLLGFDDAAPELPARQDRADHSRGRGSLWSIAGLAAILVIWRAGLDPQLYLLGAGGMLWGLALLAAGSRRGQGLLVTVMDDLSSMPTTMRALAPVQFFSWLALFAMWIYTTPAVAAVQFGSTDPQSVLYNRGADWVGVLFAAYNGFAAIAAIAIPMVVHRVGLRVCHLINLWLGGLALLSFLFIRDPNWLLLPMLAMGFAWASVVSLPYALLSSSVPAQKMGTYMGIFNFFIVIPQLVAASVLGLILKAFFGGAPIYALAIGGVSFFVAGLLALRVPDAAVPAAAPGAASLRLSS